jgi:acyl-CoA thioester hydrolase
MAAFTHQLRVRFHECDPQGVVFYPNHLMYFDVVLTELWRATFGGYGDMVESGTDVHVVHAALDFRAPARFDDALELSMEVTLFGETSITSHCETRRGGELLVSGELVHVCVTTGTHAKRPVPERLRAGLTPWSRPQ